MGRERAEPSPWQRCAACVACPWWTGWLCRQASVGYRDCPAYGVDFVETVVAIDRQTGSPRYVTLQKGERAEDVQKRPSASAGQVKGLNVLTYFDDE